MNKDGEWGGQVEAWPDGREPSLTPEAPCEEYSNPAELKISEVAVIEATLLSAVHCSTPDGRASRSRQQNSAGLTAGRHSSSRCRESWTEDSCLGESVPDAWRL